MSSRFLPTGGEADVNRAPLHGQTRPIRRHLIALSDGPGKGGAGATGRLLPTIRFTLRGRPEFAGLNGPPGRPAKALSAAQDQLSLIVIDLARRLAGKLHQGLEHPRLLFGLQNQIAVISLRSLSELSESVGLDADGSVR
jgi:hypothetical protein